MSRDSLSLRLILAVAVCTASVLFPAGAWGGTEKVLYSFKGGSDAANPQSPLTFDKTGNIYGTTSSGGRAAACSYSGGCGAVFKLAPSARGWNETLIYSFKGGTDGRASFTGVIFDNEGNLYGATASDGDPGCYSAGEGQGCGAVFKLTPSGDRWKERTLITFKDDEGGGTSGPLALDAKGNLYGSNRWGGLAGCYFGCGTVFELSPVGDRWTYTSLYAFTDGSDGANPLSGQLLRDGKLYGATSPPSPYGLGGVFELKYSKETGWTESTLYSFTGGDDGYNPYAGTVFDAAGNIYGTAAFGGSGGGGTVFKLSPSADGWTQTTLYPFTGGSDGGQPQANLTLDKAGNIYGTTGLGGLGYGVVFELVNSGGSYTYKNLYTFTGGSDGANPSSPGGLSLRDGKLYGTTPSGGAYGYGVVFEITP
jgi:uncharacterized repeat protein (TIGR03803 family)